MIINKLSRAEMFSTFANLPVLYLRDPFQDGMDYWFLAQNFKEADPSSHIHFNEMSNGKDITPIMNNANQYDQQLFLTQLTQIGKSNISFPQSVQWIKIR